MRKNIVLSLIMTVCVVVLSFACVKTDAVKEATVNADKMEIVNVVNTNTADGVLEARFLNMLNHNFVYNDAFYNDSALANDSMLALIDAAPDGFVDGAVLGDYIFNMYGKIYNDFAFLGDTEKDGCVYIIPRGYNIYTHEISSVTDNKDGSYTVLTEVEISYEDGSVETAYCETVFLENTESAFGYNIMYSIIEEGIVADSQC